MKIGIDITVLYRARAGVLNYHLRLLRAMVAQQPRRHQFLLLDYLPLHNGLPSREVDLPHAPHVQVHHVRGIRHRKLGHLDFLQRPGVETAVHAVDAVLDPAWRTVTTRVMDVQLRRYLRSVDVFHSSDVLNYAVSGAKNITTLHDLTTLILPQHHVPQIQAMQAKKFRFAQEEADVVIAVSENTRQDAIRLLGIEPERICVVPEGVDPEFRPLAKTAVAKTLAHYTLTPGSYILHVGTIEPRKNLIRLVDAYHQLRRQSAAPPPKLVLVGGKGWLFDTLYARLAELELNDNVIFLHNVPDAALPALYNGAVLFVYPSLYEGFGLPPLEAMACGVPVIAANSSSLPEVVGGAGMLVDPHDTAALADQMCYLLTHEDKRVQLRHAGLARAARFTWQQTAIETMRVYGAPGNS